MSKVKSEQRKNEAKLVERWRHYSKDLRIEKLDETWQSHRMAIPVLAVEFLVGPPRVLFLVDTCG